MATEKRLIDANVVYEKGHRTPFHIGIADLCDLKELLADAPTVDAVEVVHGRWMSLEEYAEKIGADATGYAGGWCFCSECEQQMREIYGWNYCPNCGAKMDGERKDND